MAKLKNIIKQLSEKDYKEIYDSLMESNAEKSAYVLKSLRERQLSDSKIMVELDMTNGPITRLHGSVAPPPAAPWRP